MRRGGGGGVVDGASRAGGAGSGEGEEAGHRVRPPRPACAHARLRAPRHRRGDALPGGPPPGLLQSARGTAHPRGVD
eukprot:1180446-Prorocentrum_minimum.AAC.2